eukprot:1193484-Prorocentrum_minimum.AAC.11
MPDNKGKYAPKDIKQSEGRKPKAEAEDSSAPKEKPKLSAKDWLKGTGAGIGTKSQFGVEVARWDADSELAKKADNVLKQEAKNPYKKNRRLDQWDEEYDMGRLKKVRTGKEEDQGPSGTENPFQKWSKSKESREKSKSKFKKSREGK